MTDIRVLCRAESHEPYVVAGLSLVLLDAGGEETDDPALARSRVWSADSRDSGIRLAGWRSVKQFLSDDDHLKKGAGRNHRANRSRFVFECPHCGDRSVIRSERLEPILDRVAIAGLDSVPLSIMP